MFEGRFESVKRLNLLYDDVERHYHVVTNLTSYMAKRYVCKLCNRICRSDITHVCNLTCRDCMTNPPCAFSEFRIPCDECNRHFRSRTVSPTISSAPQREKPYANVKHFCATCGAVVSRENHECNKRFCQNCGQNREAGHLCYMRTLKGELPTDGSKVLYVFYDFETT